MSLPGAEEEAGQTSYAWRVLKDIPTGIIVAGYLHPSAGLAVSVPDFALEQDCPACARIREMIQKHGLAAAWRIQLTGEASADPLYVGRLYIFLPVSDLAEGSEVTVLYCWKGTLKSCVCIVKDGGISFYAEGPASFAVFAGNLLQEVQA